ncbi:MAG: NifB/NifX family molybdenum-iron cluster-binding protein [Candidatus Omnitrophica bacterium]|jgi:predicted Fe-Mo cluster-binding NifX family protein|nr:NifB/NifX family molybdenum-iron cluster-binding protein [Candidatus Omnitrophota bacterium]
MRLCIPTETNEGKNARVFGHFGSAPYFTIVDIEKDSLETIDNANQHHAHGMCQPMHALTGKSIDAVVTGGMGARAVQGLNQSGIKAYRAIPGTVAEIVSQFTKGGLEEITVQNACVRHGCH